MHHTIVRRAMACILFALASPIAAIADPLPEPWESRRKAASPLTDKACRGDPGAIREVWDRVRNRNDAVLQSNLTWLAINCKNFKLSEAERASWTLKAALAGYPIAMGNYAERQIRGQGVPKDVKAGLVLAERAIAAGYGTAAVNLARSYAEGRVLPRDLVKAEAYLAKARREGVDRTALDRVRASIATVREQTAANAANVKRAKETAPKPLPSTSPKAGGNRITVLGGAFPAQPKRMPRTWVNTARDPDRHRNRIGAYIVHGKVRVAGPFDQVNWLYEPDNIQTNETRLFIAGMCNTDDPQNGMWVKIIVGMTLEVKKTFRGVCFLGKAAYRSNGNPTLILGRNLRDIRYDARRKKTHVTLDRVRFDGLTYEKVEDYDKQTLALCTLDPRVDRPTKADICFDS